MMTRLVKDHPFTRVTETYESNSIYWPIRWNAGYVLSDNRKKVVRNRHLTVMMWLSFLIVFAVVLVFLSDLRPIVTTPEPVNPERLVRLGNEAFDRKNYPEAQKAYQQAIQAGISQMEIWRRYDRALLMKVFHQTGMESELLNPGNSIRMERPLNVLPVDSAPDSNRIGQEKWMNEQEWQEMKQKVHEWLGC
jgi:hypothetical protein